MPRGGARPGAGRKPRAQSLPDGPQTIGRPSRAEQRKQPEQILLEQIGKEYESLATVGLSESVVQRLALEGLAAVRHAANRGNLRAAIYLVNLLLGTPDRPYAAKASQMSEDALRLEMVQEFERSFGVDHETAELLATQAFAKAEEEARAAAEAAAVAAPTGLARQEDAGEGPHGAEGEED